MSDFNTDDLSLDPPTPARSAYGRGAGASSDIPVGTAVSSPSVGKALLPSPFMDLSNVLIPEDPKQAYWVCKFLSVISPLHKSYIHNMTRLSVPNIRIVSTSTTSVATMRAANHLSGDSESGTTVAPVNPKADEIEEVLRTTLKTVGALRSHVASLLTYDAAVTVIFYPFKKMLGCASCGHDVAAEVIEGEWSFHRNFEHTCPSCGHRGRSIATDRPLNSMDGVRLVNIPMDRIWTLHNGFTQETWLYYEIPRSEQELFSNRHVNKEFVLTHPQVYLDAISVHDTTENRVHSSGPLVRLREGEYFLSMTDSQPKGRNGLPIPQFIASAPDTWAARLMQKANTVTAAGNIHPLRILYPDTSNKENLYKMLDVGNYMGKLQEILERHTQDPNFRGVAPFPVDSTTVGGDGKATMLHAEIRAAIEMSAAGLGNPIEFFFGGLSFSGSSVSIKVLTALLLTLNTEASGLLKWIIRKLSAKYFQDGSMVGVVDSPDLGEDLQRLSLLSTLASEQKIGLYHLDRILNTNRHQEQIAVQQDAQFTLKLRDMEARSQAKQQREMTFTDARTQAQASISAAMASVHHKAELASHLRRDPDMMNTALANPSEAGAILGTNSKEMVEPASPEGAGPLDPRAPVSLSGMDLADPAAYGADQPIPMPHVQKEVIRNEKSRLQEGLDLIARTRRERDMQELREQLPSEAVTDLDAWIAQQSLSDNLGPY